MPRKRFLETMKFARLYNQKLPDKNTSNPALYELYLTSNLWIAFLNNAASEQSARMNAMENASKNAREIVDKLNLQYNKARPAASGKAALKSGVPERQDAIWIDCNAQSSRGTRCCAVDGCQQRKGKTNDPDEHDRDAVDPGRVSSGQSSMVHLRVRAKRAAKE